ncbi:MAG: hypothetical protein GY898_33715 [Proteobacteria bacterium]|nr:hypothetical protein [Pseudomonadota bacterium]
MRTKSPLLLAALVLLVAAPVIAGGGSLWIDDDGDGYCENSCAQDSEGLPDGDCDDTDPLIGPFDGDGDGDEGCQTDCDDQDPTIHGRDDDGDGVSLCDEVPDCDDTDAYTYPDALEWADGLDNDCDGEIDEEVDEVDDDEDGLTEADGDCDDSNPAVYTGAIEFCDGRDNDCDNIVDGDDEDYPGSDADGDGDPAVACGGADCRDYDATANGLDADGDGNTLCQTNPDCDDDDATAYPGAEEICGDDVDNDCSGAPDDLDEDGDEAISLACGGEDCDDTNFSIDPNAPEEQATCIDQIDNDCDCPGDTNGDGIECGLGDEGVDGGDEDCHAAPEAQAGVDQQDRYLGGAIIVALDGADSSDDNPGDELTYTWTVEPVEAYSGITWELIHDPADAIGYLRFSADPENEDNQWLFTATLVVNDGVLDSEDDEEDSHVTITFFRPEFLSTIACATAGQTDALGGLALLLGLGGLLGLRRRRA